MAAAFCSCSWAPLPSGFYGQWEKKKKTILPIGISGKHLLFLGDIMLWRQAQQELKMHVEAGSKLVLIQIFAL